MVGDKERWARDLDFALVAGLSGNKKWQTSPDYMYHIEFLYDLVLMSSSSALSLVYHAVEGWYTLARPP